MYNMSTEQVVWYDVLMQFLRTETSVEKATAAADAAVKAYREMFPNA